MTSHSLDLLLSRFSDLSILVVGDFFLDRYLDIDPTLSETSLETGLEANQVVRVRNHPGAAGTVTNNLCALGIGKVLALGCIGEDGHGFDLERGLIDTGVDTTHLVRSPKRSTPTYTKPMDTVTGKERERLDIKNRIPTPPEIEEEVLRLLQAQAANVDGVVVLDQVQEAECGVVTSRVRESAAALGREQPELPVLADSRERIDEFRQVIVKPNEAEARKTVGRDDLRSAAVALANRNGRPVFITRGAQGLLAADEESVFSVQAVQVPQPIDPVGAGDSVSASLIAALAAGASCKDAAKLGVLAASITIQQIGTTGVATPDQIRQRFLEYPLDVS